MNYHASHPMHHQYADKPSRMGGVPTSDKWLMRLTGLTSLFSVGLSVALFFALLSASFYAWGVGPTSTTSPTMAVWALLLTNAILLLIALTIAIPVGMTAGLYLVEFASNQMKFTTIRIYRFLSGIPTVIYGFFAIVMVTPLLQNLIPSLAPYNGLTAALVTGLLLTPLICNKTIQAIEAIPTTLSEAAVALGMSRSTRLWHIVLPAAQRQLGASLFFVVARIVGETMIVAVSAGHLHAAFSLNPFGPMATVNAHILHQFSTVQPGNLEFGRLFFIAFVLLVVSSIFTFIGSRLLNAQEGAR